MADYYGHLTAVLAKIGNARAAKQERERLLASGVTFSQEKEAQALLKQLQAGKE